MLLRRKNGHKWEEERWPLTLRPKHQEINGPWKCATISIGQKMGKFLKETTVCFWVFRNWDSVVSLSGKLLAFPACHGSWICQWLQDISLSQINEGLRPKLLSWEFQASALTGEMGLNGTKSESSSRQRTVSEMSAPQGWASLSFTPGTPLGELSFQLS